MKRPPNDPNFMDIDNLPPGGAHFYLLADGKTFVLTKDLIVVTRLGTITIPAGFMTDLASIPKRLRSFISVLGKHFIAAILHDYWYRVVWARKIGNIIVTKEEVDDVFLEEMADAKVSWWERRVMWRMVGAFGDSSWREK